VIALPESPVRADTYSMGKEVCGKILFKGLRNDAYDKYRN